MPLCIVSSSAGTIPHVGRCLGRAAGKWHPGLCMGWSKSEETGAACRACCGASGVLPDPTPHCQALCSTLQCHGWPWVSPYQPCHHQQPDPQRKDAATLSYAERFYFQPGLCFLSFPAGCEAVPPSPPCVSPARGWGRDAGTAHWEARWVSQRSPCQPL